MADSHAHHDDHSHGGLGKYWVVFLALCALTTCSFATQFESWPFEKAPTWIFMMGVSCVKAMLVILFFMHLKWEANWKYVLTIPAGMMSVFLVLMLVPDIGNRVANYSEERIVHAAESLVNNKAEQYELEREISWTEVFDASVNDKECVDKVISAAEATGHDVKLLDEPFRWAEDFGAISASAKGAMFAFGAGEDRPQIHNSDYDFPDELIDRGKSIFYEIYRDFLL